MKSPFPKRESSRPFWTHIPPGFDPPDMPTEQDIKEWEENRLEEAMEEDMRSEMREAFRRMMEDLQREKKPDAKL